MYQKYQTEALILGSRARGEADKVIALYTKDFGFLRARARAVRAETSKMRYALQNYSHARVGLVRGAGGWRIAGAHAIRGAGGWPSSVAVFARIARLVMRLVAGEERNPYLYDALAEAHHALLSHDALSRLQLPRLAAVELLCAARVLFALGYISEESMATALFTHTAYAETHLEEAAALEKDLLSSINRALNETHL